MPSVGREEKEQKQIQVNKALKLNDTTTDLQLKYHYITTEKSVGRLGKFEGTFISH